MDTIYKIGFMGAGPIAALLVSGMVGIILGKLVVGIIIAGFILLSTFFLLSTAYRKYTISDSELEIEKFPFGKERIALSDIQSFSFIIPVFSTAAGRGLVLRMKNGQTKKLTFMVFLNSDNPKKMEQALISKSIKKGDDIKKV
jgi:hypothetical protein